jgi:hypothetical protein
MGYTYSCDHCGEKGSSPAFMGQFSEQWWMTSEVADHLKEHGYYELGDTLTFCGNCTQQILLTDGP